MAIIVKYKTSNGTNEVEQRVYWQAHQSTSTVRPQNTMAAFRYAWDLGGIPEADIRTTKDGVIICFHDATPARTADVDDKYKDMPISSFAFEEIQKWDVGIKLGDEYKGERVPALEEAFNALKQDEDRLIYLDLKEVDLKILGKLIDKHGVNRQVIFTHNNEKNCREMKNIVADIRTMLWIGGSPEKIKEKFNKVLNEKFEGLDQVQIHLNKKKEGGEWPYQIGIEFLKYAFDRTSEAGVELEVLPFHEFEDGAIHTLLDIGIRWFAVDYPERFIKAVKSWK